MKTDDIAPPRLTARHALFLDFDGTLAPIQDDPDTVELPAGGASTLDRLAGQLDGALAVVSGRDVRDLSARLPGGLWRAGGHGLEICQPGEAPAPRPAPGPAELEERLAEAVAGHPGTRLETKGAVYAIHYRAVPAQGAPLASALERLVDTMPDYRLQRGKMVFELKPSRAHKGKALQHLMTRAPFAGRTPVMVGDDTTDEDAMAVALQLSGLAVKVGEGESLATHRLDSPAAVFAWLQGGLA